jgi:hypothetical protein
MCYIPKSLRKKKYISLLNLNFGDVVMSCENQNFHSRYFVKGGGVTTEPNSGETSQDLAIAAGFRPLSSEFDNNSQNLVKVARILPSSDETASPVVFRCW